MPPLKKCGSTLFPIWCYLAERQIFSIELSSRMLSPNGESIPMHCTIIIVVNIHCRTKREFCVDTWPKTRIVRYAHVMRTAHPEDQLFFLLLFAISLVNTLTLSYSHFHHFFSSCFLQPKASVTSSQERRFEKGRQTDNDKRVEALIWHFYDRFIYSAGLHKYLAPFSFPVSLSPPLISPLPFSLDWFFFPFYFNFNDCFQAIVFAKDVHHLTKRCDDDDAARKK